MKKLTIGLLLVGTVVFAVFMLLVGATSTGANVAMERGISGMIIGLIVVWIFIGGGLMYRMRDRFRVFVLASVWGWKKKFVIASVCFALIEEAITTTLTNSAPLFGAKVGEAHITASANFFDVVFLHSVIVFIPLFIAWTWVLTRYDFKPFTVFILFGLMGVVVEASFIGPTAFIGFPMWIFVYGLMIYLPVYALPENRGAKPVRFYHYIVAIPAVFLLAIPMLIPIVFVVTKVLNHPTIHF